MRFSALLKSAAAGRTDFTSLTFPRTKATDEGHGQRPRSVRSLRAGVAHRAKAVAAGVAEAGEAESVGESIKLVFEAKCEAGLMQPTSGPSRSLPPPPLLGG